MIDDVEKPSAMSAVLLVPVAFLFEILVFGVRWRRLSAILPSTIDREDDDSATTHANG
jgi:hypothetical protein